MATKDIPVVVAVSEVPNHDVYIYHQFCGLCGTSLQKPRKIGDACYACRCEFNRIMYVWYNTNSVLTHSEIRRLKILSILK